jgi:DNA-binding NarL/FixJ family response regulator
MVDCAAVARGNRLAAARRYRATDPALSGPGFPETWSSAAMALRVLLADAHRLTLEGAKATLALDPAIEVVGEAFRAADVLAALKQVEADVVVLDLELPDMDGIACIGLIRQNYPSVNVVVLSGANNPERIDAALRTGAAGYILKSIHPSDLASAIRQVTDRSVFTSIVVQNPALAALGTVASGAADHPGAAADLTERELTMLQAVARGLSNKAISKELWVTEQTVKFHLNNLYRKLGVPNRTAAARFAFEHGLLDGVAA